ncbi:uncharacterized protein F4817DRAFT_354649 [Daldinia loculata]|uniref:uncharacterized protein n=1 Tax=Daldinia loculata TaxID=103429 RepID=UPI0020C4FA96|nr:uncharacterized protein F4817DRAFT_354649 [Daldinia loculata]KAI1641845.1 hypothetical protein F4817DRAFT_354649 [Daldinia loculata]
MRGKTDCFVLAFATFGGLAAAEKGAAQIHGCVWVNTKPVKPYIVNWSPGSSSDRCMRLTGSAASMTVSDKGIICQDLGKVAVDSSGTCYFKQSWWGLSYTSTAAYSGSTNSRWTTGPANSDVTLYDYSPGTSVCSSMAHCPNTYVEWSNGANASLYFVFTPGAVGDPGKKPHDPDDPDDLAEDEFGSGDRESVKLNVQVPELEI